VPPPLTAKTVEAAVLTAAGSAAGVLAPQTAALVERMVRVMGLAKFKTLAVLVLGITLVAAAAFHGAAAPPAPEGRAALPSASAAAQPAAAPEIKVEEEGEAGVSVQELPPVVVKTAPQSGDTEVDAAKVSEIRVTFSKAMTDKSWSWTTLSKESFPKLAGKPHYDKDGRTCVLPVKLDPGKTYAVWLNSEKFHGFQDAAGHPAVPYLLVFETKAEGK
jgi:RNA polymerase sigma-70 factor (ECF subfamily)